MNKPLSYYTTYVPGDECYLDELQRQYGTCLQKLTRRERLFLINAIVSSLCRNEKGDISAEVVTTSYDVTRRLSNTDMEGLIESLINQIRWGNHGETIT